MSTATATFAAGCFWGVEETFRNLEGVQSTEVGYTGGTSVDPTYEEVCTGTTEHAEAVRIVYDPERIDYDTLLDVFWQSHNPTTRDRQGPDIGSQYRSAIFYEDTGQETAARESIARLEKEGRFAQPIVTQVVPAGDFYRAEEYHQQYLAKRGQGHCSIP